MTRALLASLTALAALALAASSVGCDPADRVPARSAKPAPCPPPPEPTYQAVVVGTIGKLHLVESRYPLSRLGDVLTAFKPDLVLLAVRVDPFREDRLEDASFEMTYASHLAKQHGAYLEPIDWFREQDFGAAPAPVEPWDAAEIAKKETSVLSEPRLFTFEAANGADMAQRILLATAAESRYRAGDPAGSRRRGYVQNLTLTAVARHDRPKRVLAFVDVLDRPTVDGALHTAGYTTKLPSDVVAKAKEVMIGDLPPEVLAAYRAQHARAKEQVAKATGPAHAFWAEREKVLGVVVEKKAACCVTQAALTSER